MTVTKPLLDSKNATFGVTAVNVKFDSLFDDVTYYRKGQYSYALLVTREGIKLSILYRAATKLPREIA